MTWWNKWRNTLFAKLMLSFMLIMLVSFALSSLVLFHVVKKQLWDGIRSSENMQQQRVIQHIVQAREAGWSQEALKQSLTFSMGPGSRLYQVYDAQGQLLYAFGNSHTGTAVDLTWIQQVLTGQELRQEYKEGDRTLLVTGVYIEGELMEKALLIQSYISDREIRRIVNPYILSTSIALPIAFIFFYLLSRRMTDPLKQMSQAALKYAKGDFRERLHITSGDEIGQLSQTINVMAEELSSIEGMRREFLANVSHDLKTPITSMHGFLSAMLDGTIPPERHTHYLELIRDSSDRMMKLVGDLLDIASIEAGQFGITRTRFNLSEQIRLTMARIEPMFYQHGVAVHLHNVHGDLYVDADEDRIGQVMINLLQNALQHSRRGSEIQVTIEVIGDQAVVTVQDHGSGISPEELSLIWERFYKSDKARSSKTGTGIGLSIVKHIIELHDTDISVTSVLGKGSSFVFSLPLLNE
ncbi:integral membrane sensor signal transduction histidine kinase [Paenibacillus algicola]|uniref:histidine kinase n=1 Tax=Paenibacillus algicola TaxID=2565926 RepID=A0A4P8XL88_9BACL|nr:ATP-binding protein [Paenibacillus algicola]QCT03542.1 integral membrane sensor signal transduction histidine kinase [Paenibacillus algicola]